MLHVSFKTKLATLMAVVVTSATFMSANMADPYYSGEDKVNPLLEASELYKWVENGKITPDGKRVIIMDIVPSKAQSAFFKGDLATLEKYGMKWIKYADKAGYVGHIPGAQIHMSHEKGAGHIKTRSDGPMKVIHQLGDAKTVNKFMQSHGITKDSVVVLTTSDFTRPGYCDTRAYWTLRYWGMSKNNLRILNGGNVAWADYVKANHPEKLAAMGLQKGAQKTKVVRSKMTIDQFPHRFTEKRAVIGEIFKDMDDGKVADGSVTLFDARPPTAFYIKDISKFEKYIKGGKLALKAGQDGAPQFDPKQFSPVIVKGSNVGVLKGAKGPVPVTISSKAEAFEAQLKGAKLIKGKNAKGELYNVGFTSVLNMKTIKDDSGKPVFKFFYTYKKPTDIASPAPWAKKATVAEMFAKVFPNKDNKIIVNCNSGSSASIAFFYLSEMLGYKDVKDYDGSFIEWGNLAGFEPNNKAKDIALQGVRPDVYTWLPNYPLNFPAISLLASEAHPFSIEKSGDKYMAIDAVTGKQCSVGSDDCWVKEGGVLKKNVTWDTLSRSQNILFRPNKKVNTGVFKKKDNLASTAEYNKKKNWAKVVVRTKYNGSAQETLEKDRL